MTVSIRFPNQDFVCTSNAVKNCEPRAASRHPLIGFNMKFHMECHVHEGRTSSKIPEQVIILIDYCFPFHIYTILHLVTQLCHIGSSQIMSLVMPSCLKGHWSIASCWDFTQLESRLIGVVLHVSDCKHKLSEPSVSLSTTLSGYRHRRKIKFSTSVLQQALEI